MIFNFLHLIFGYITIRADGGFIERFINLCTSKGIPLWNIRKHGDSLCARTSIHGYINLHKVAKTSGMKITVLKKAGLPFITRKYRKRFGIGAGIIIFSLGLFLLSGRAWIIDVSGNSTVDSVRIEEAFEHSGLKIGSKFSKLDANTIRINALSELDGVSWATINVRGCKAVIEIREAIDKPEIEPNQGTSNLIASKDGQVEIVEPYRGIAKVKPGQTVLKGSLLISGIRENRIQENLFSDSCGYVVARTTQSVDYSENKAQKYYSFNQKDFYSVYFLGVKYPFVPNKKADMIYTDLSKATLNSVSLPFGIKKTVFTTLKQTKKTSKDFTLLASMEEYALKSYNQTLHTQIISQNIEMSQNGLIEIKGEYSCFENICKRVEFTVEEIPSDEQ